ncbi:Molybdenum transport system permease protein ModB (TC 3.A.1.8.1) [Microbacterium esteraromaticum]|uniref:Molybdenum transport system permease n=1 Tax=Microbacterium esteraromaticum TaxID=57043 RepID=A0A1R4KQI0_9MICO|nr:Molybdenum transport system permease protein ModB (TC 3.A.1.8.1) [Microbacterium esteraromaticum]
MTSIQRGRRDTGTGTPFALIAPAVLGVMLLILPLFALITRASWATLWQDITSQAALDALRLSLVTGLAATALCLVLGLPLALLMARSGPRVSALLRALVAVPLVLPPMVGGVALLFLFGRTSPLGQLLAQAFDVTLPFTPVAVVLAQAFVALPFLVLAVEGTIRGVGGRYERTAATLGARPWRVLWRITLPLATPGIVVGVILCFARAIGEFGATALFAGNSPGVTQTMPLAIYTAFNGAGTGRETAVALSILLLATAVAVLLLVRAWRPGALK